MEGGGPMHSDSIVNRKGGVESSMYQSCLVLKNRLERVRDFEQWLEEMKAEEREEDVDTDPVTSMWNMLRKGRPLLTIFNSTGPPQPLEPKVTSRLTADDTKFAKQATFDFLKACFDQLAFEPSECFIISDLYGVDTTGFVKVLRLVNRVLDLAEERGMLHAMASSDNPDVNGTKPKTHAENVINEIVITERDYVQHLETLQEFQVLLQQANVLPGDTLHSIFMNLNNLLDFQRRFLIRVEQQNSLDPDLQNWGQLFHMYREQFRVYEPFIANQTRCNNTVTKEWERIRAVPLPTSYQGMVETQAVLLGFLLKPFQRLVKYPMLLEQLIKKGDYDDERVHDLKLGVEATNGILSTANEAVAKEARVAAAHDLQVSVEDWKGHKLDEFGELLIFGGQTVLKGDGSKEIERDYKVYLFEKILLCCKDINPNKAKNKLSGKYAQKSKQRLQLKGRIWMNTITDIVHYSRENSFYLNIYWRGDPSIENFIIRYISKDNRDKWKSLIEQQRKARNGIQSQSQSPDGRSAMQPPVDLHSFSGQTLTNLYTNDDDDDDDDVRYTPTTNSMSSYSGLTSSRNPSSNSLGSRKGSTGPAPPPPPPPSGMAGRVAPPRFPIPETYSRGGPPLPLLQTASNNNHLDRDNSSFFSPTVESPAVSFGGRASNASSYHSSKPSGSHNNSWESKHLTAPPMGRPQQDEGMHPGRAQRPSLPVGSLNGYSANHTQMSQGRIRAASSPHFQPAAGDRRSGGSHAARTPNDDEPIPPLPLHMQSMRAPPISRSPSSSPTDMYRQPRQQPPPLTRAPHSLPIGQHDARLPQVYGAGAGAGGPVQAPSQLRVKICFEPRPSHVTIVVPNVIRYQTLIGRIDAKMERISAASISRGTARLKYSDSDGDLITIGNDEDVRSAIEEWTEANEAALRQQLIPDFELWWIEIRAH